MGGRHRGFVYERTMPGPQSPPMFRHRCPQHNLTIGAWCERCEAPLFPTDCVPAGGHGYVRCQETGEVVLGCPLGVAMRDDNVRESVGAGAGASGTSST